MRILLAGADGQLGRDCQTVLGAAHDLCCLGRPELDITDPAGIERWMRRVKPGCVVNCAAYTRVDEAESRPELCRAVNADGPRHLAAACRRHDALLVHISTDYVFDGTLPPGQAYGEDASPNPLGVYGRAKLEGEAPVLALAGGAVLRTAWLYGAHSDNFLRTMLRLALRRPPQPIRVVADQFGSPTWSGRLARQIARLLEDFRPGLHHAAAQGGCSRCELARFFLGHMDVPHRIVPVTTAEYPVPAPRPANAVLENRNLRAAGLEVMVPWEADVAAFAGRVRETWLRAAADDGRNGR